MPDGSNVPRVNTTSTQGRGAADADRMPIAGNSSTEADPTTVLVTTDEGSSHLPPNAVRRRPARARSVHDLRNYAAVCSTNLTVMS